MDLFATAAPALGEALALVFHPVQLMYLVAGVLLGLSIGVLPGLGGIAGLSLALPFMYGMEPVAGLALMVGLVAVIPTSDTFSSVLLGIPGSSASQATVLDGFPLARKGEAARALSAAFASSLFGGLFGAVILTGFIFVARPLILAFGLPEMLMITVLGLSMVAILAGRVPLKGVVAAGLGLMAGTIGAAGAGGSLRMSSYSIPYLVDGLQLVIVGLGIYAIPEIVSLLRQDRPIAGTNELGSGWLQGIADWWRNLWLSMRCAVIGVLVGVIPGLGGSVVDWIAYGSAVQMSKDRSMYGQGDIRGVIAPESSNNAKEGGGLVPTLIFGIPGSGSMAIFLGGLALLGMTPGPQMVRNDLDVTYTIVWSLALANVVGAGLCIALSRWIARLTTIRFTLLAPYLFMLIAFAAFQSRQSLGDLAALVAIGALGILLRRFDFSRPAFLIGFVLSGQAEGFANMANQVAGSRFRRSWEAGFDYVFSPIVIGLIILTAVSILVGIRQSKNIRENVETHTGGKRAPAIFMGCVTAYLIVAWLDAASISRVGDKIFPLVVGGVTLLGCFALLFRMWRAPATDDVFIDLESGGGRRRRPARPVVHHGVVPGPPDPVGRLRPRHRAGAVPPGLLPHPRRALLAPVGARRRGGDRLHPVPRRGARARLPARPAAIVVRPALALHMTQHPVPYLFLRGGTSRGPYFRRADLPEDRDALSEVLIAIVGAGHPWCIDGLGGGTAVTTKVAMLSPSAREGCEVDYLFAQVGVAERAVDYRPTCGNILAGVGPAAIEMGLVAARDGETRVRIHALNTGARIEAVVRTPGGRVEYEGDAEIAGVPGTAASVTLDFLDTVGSATGALLPTGEPIDVIDGVAVTCMDVAMPVMMARAEAFGLTGTESAAELDADRGFFARAEAIRREAGRRMGMGDVAASVTPKIALLSPPRQGGTITARYTMPWAAHPSMAVTGAQCVAACAMTPGTVADGLARGLTRRSPERVAIEHPSGTLEVTVSFEDGARGMTITSAGLLRTARLIARGKVMVPGRVWAGAAGG